jgi:aspartate carbamoyltransferase catalytic subunit
MPQEYIQFARSRDITISETDDLLAAMPDLDVLYVTRVQRERFVNQELENLAHRAFGRGFEHLEPAVAEALRPVAEIQAVREYEKARAAYFRQVQNGLYIRMALMAAALGRLE